MGAVRTYSVFWRGKEKGKGQCANKGNKKKTELSLTVPIVNTTAFLFTVIGEWYVEGKVISRGEYLTYSFFSTSFPTVLEATRREEYANRGE